VNTILKKKNKPKSSLLEPQNMILLLDKGLCRCNEGKDSRRDHPGFKCTLKPSDGIILRDRERDKKGKEKGTEREEM
jgi:hypothetical protein